MSGCWGLRFGAWLGPGVEGLELGIRVIYEDFENRGSNFFGRTQRFVFVIDGSAFKRRGNTERRGNKPKRFQRFAPSQEGSILGFLLERQGHNLALTFCLCHVRSKTE